MGGQMPNPMSGMGGGPMGGMPMGGGMNPMMFATRGGYGMQP